MTRKVRQSPTTIQLKVQDAIGENLMVNRDVLRRTYTAVKDLCRHFILHPHTGEASLPALSISFIESQAGDVAFIVDPPPSDGHGARRGSSLFRKDLAPSRTSSGSGYVTVLRNTAFLAQATIFAIEVGGVHCEPVDGTGLVDLISHDGAQRLRVPWQVARALAVDSVQESLRELFSAVGEEGVASIILGLEPDSPERRLEFVIPAADDVVQFVNGQALPLGTAA